LSADVKKTRALFKRALRARAAGGSKTTSDRLSSLCDSAADPQASGEFESVHCCQTAHTIRVCPSISRTGRASTVSVANRPAPQISPQHQRKMSYASALLKGRPMDEDASSSSVSSSALFASAAKIAAAADTGIATASASSASGAGSLLASAGAGAGSASSSGAADFAAEASGPIKPSFPAISAHVAAVSDAKQLPF